MVSEAERLRRLTEAVAREVGEPERFVWMSFADSTRSVGEQFLGATIVRAYGPATATVRAHALGLNPGGEVMFVEFDQEEIGSDGISTEQFDFMFERLRSRPEIEAAGFSGP